MVADRRPGALRALCNKGFTGGKVGEKSELPEWICFSKCLEAEYAKFGGAVKTYPISVRAKRERIVATFDMARLNFISPGIFVQVGEISKPP